MSAYSAAVIADGASVYYRHGEATGFTMVDALGVNNGTYNSTNGPTFAQPGALNIDADTAVSFPGTGNGATAPSHTALDLGDVFSIECWFKRGSIGTVQTLFSKSTNGYDLTFNASDQLELRKAPGGVVAHTPAQPDMTAWHHMVATKNGADRCMYIDKIDVAVMDTNVAFADTTATLRVAFFSAGNARYNGLLDETAFYKNVILTPAQVQNHYELGKGMFRIPAAPIIVTALGPATETSLGLPAASVSGAAATTPTLAVPPPAGVVTGTAPPPTETESVAVPPGAVDSAGQPPDIQVDISIPIPPVGITGAAASPATEVGVGIPPALVAGVGGDLATSAEAAVPPGEVNADTVPPEGFNGVLAQIPSASVDASAPAPGSTLDVPLPPAEITGVAPPPAGDIGQSEAVPAAEVVTSAPPPGIQVDVSLPIPAGVVNATGPPPTITGADPGVGDDGGDGGGFYRPRRAPKKQPSIDVSVVIPSARVNVGTVPPNYYLNEPDEDLAILLLYGA